MAIFNSYVSFPEGNEFFSYDYGALHRTEYIQCGVSGPNCLSDAVCSIAESERPRGWDGFCSVQFISSEGFTLWLFNSSPWEIDGLPNLKMVICHGYVSHNQRVTMMVKDMDFT